LVPTDWQIRGGSVRDHLWEEEPPNLIAAIEDGVRGQRCLMEALENLWESRGAKLKAKNESRLAIYPLIGDCICENIGLRNHHHHEIAAHYRWLIPLHRTTPSD
jgi:hypothetical protein